MPTSPSFLVSWHPNAKAGITYDHAFPVPPKSSGTTWTARLGGSKQNRALGSPAWPELPTPTLFSSQLRPPHPSVHPKTSVTVATLKLRTTWLQNAQNSKSDFSIFFFCFNASPKFPRGPARPPSPRRLRAPFIVFGGLGVPRSVRSALTARMSSPASTLHVAGQAAEGVSGPGGQFPGFGPLGTAIF